MRFRVSRTLLVLTGLVVTFSYGATSETEGHRGNRNQDSGERRGKHVLFCVGLGTPSHSVALFEIGRELKRRGHTFSYAGFKTIAEWDKDHEFNFFPVGEQSWGGAIKDKGASASLTEGPRGVAHLGAVISQIVPPTYEPQYTDLLRLLNGTTPLPSHVGPFDLLVCDNFAFFCSDLASQLGLPYMVANHGFFFGVGDAPYLLDSLEGDPEVSRSFALRFKNKVLLPLVAKRAFAPLGKALAETRSRVAPWLPVLADPNPYSRWQKVPILNTGSFFGWDEPRELSPLVHMVGPIVTHRVRNPPPLDEAFQAIFDGSGGKPVVLVAMGSFAALSGTRAEKLLHAFKKLREDGVIGAAIISSKADPPSPLTREMLHSDEWGVAWVSWAPQTAILAHPLTRAFVSHGGQESVYEAMYWGTPLLVLPSFVDQFTNGEKAKAAGLGLTLDKHAFTADEVYHKLRKLIQDEDGSVTAASDHLQHLIRLAAVDKDKAGASAIESQLFVGHRHLQTLPQREASWWVYNWDVYGVTLLAALLLVRVVMLLLAKCLGGATGGKKERAKAA